MLTLQGQDPRQGSRLYHFGIAKSLLRRNLDAMGTSDRATAPERVDELVHALASVLEHETEQGTIERLEETHVKDRGTGYCVGCIQYQRPSHRWPCNIIRAIRVIQSRRAAARSGSPGAQDGSSTPLRVVE